jgi:phage terminase large subunit
VEVLESSGKTLTLDRVKVQLESYKAFKEGKRIVVNQGGTRSGKTFGLMKLLIALAYKDKYSISITSLSFPHLRKGALRDWRTIMENYDLYSVPEHMRTENTYYFPTGSYMEFFSVDDHLKVRGPGRDILFINEANLIDFDTFTQLLLRTKVCCFIDYNPADEFHWIYDKILTRPDTHFIKSTYQDNPFLPNEQVREIENLKNVDENYWRIYGEGERGHSEGVIYTHWDNYSVCGGGGTYYGLDFGFNAPSALVKITEVDKEIFAEELLYQSQLTNQDLISLLKQLVQPGHAVYCDSAEPARIAEIRKAGINALPADKDVKAGIMFLKGRKLHIHQGSANLIKEIKSYKFLNKDSKDLLPLKMNDHACDALRYATTALRKTGGTHSQPMFIR